MNLIYKTTRLIATICIVALTKLSAETITLYTYRHYESDDALFQRFTELTGIEVEVIKSKAGALVERLNAEGATTPADVLLTVDVGGLYLAQEAGVLQPLESNYLDERIPEYLREPQGYWYGLTKRARVIVYNPDFVNAEELSTYEALAGAEWKGRLLARSSSNIYNQSLLASILANSDSATATAWAKAVRENMARPPQGNDRDQMRAVAAGLADVALVNTYYLGLLAHSENKKDRDVAAKLRLFFPNQNDRGTHINISGAGVVKHADNFSGAQKFIEFLASDEAQQVLPDTTSEYPVVESVEWSPLQKSWGKFKADRTSISSIGKLNPEAIRCFNKAGWE